MSKNTGHFERLIYAAYIWLILGALFEIYDAGVMIVGTARPFGQDVSRHLYLMGFITHLILGVSVRMLPGFMGKKKIFSPALVKATLCLGVLSVLTRILPLVVPSALIESRPEIIPVLGAGFGISGSLGMLTILCLSINIVFTYRMKS